MIKLVSSAGFLLSLLCNPANAQAVMEIGRPSRIPDVIESVMLHPPYRSVYFCGEHTASDLLSLGDALGKDCLVAQPLRGVGPDAPYVFYRGSGKRNEEWFTWRVPVLAPVDGLIEMVHRSGTENAVGKANRSEPPSMILFVRNDGLRVLYAHLHTISVSEGERVIAGQQVGTAGNNGKSRNPHTHIGAWRDLLPLQIRFDPRVGLSPKAP
jgi:hypothetical protein